VKGNGRFFPGHKKTKVTLEAVKGTKTFNEVAQEYGVHPNPVSQWKKRVVGECGQPV